MNFETWILSKGLSKATAKKYAGTINGPLSEWAQGVGLIHASLDSISSLAQFEEVSRAIQNLPIFCRRNEVGNDMYGATLKKYGQFLADTTLNDIEYDIDTILATTEWSETEKSNLIKSRLGQGLFRRRLISYWNGCAVTGYSDTRLLRASHIKPWRVASNRERLDPYNGLLLLPSLDSTFDSGLITFHESGLIALSPQLEAPQTLGINPGMKVSLEPSHQPYLEYHRASVFWST